MANTQGMRKREREREREREEKKERIKGRRKEGQTRKCRPKGGFLDFRRETDF
jgi:hypothetical protein